jgi:hypothetical protein
MLSGLRAARLFVMNRQNLSISATCCRDSLTASASVRTRSTRLARRSVPVSMKKDLRVSAAGLGMIEAPPPAG